MKIRTILGLKSLFRVVHKKEGSLDRFPSFCVLFAMHHEIIYISVIEITLIYNFVILRFFHTILSEFPLTGRAPCAPLCI